MVILVGGEPNLSGDTWHHIVYVWNDGLDEARTYANSNLTNTISMNGGCFADNDGGFNLGTDHWTNDGSHLLGQISEIKAFDRVLNNNEINDLFNKRTNIGILI